jgi:regulator of protease activity HflC (stomatin/prohibitin superfamily)
MPPAITITLIFVGLALLITLPSFQIIKENEMAIVERLGKYHKTIKEPGIHIMMPFVERIIERIPTEPFYISKKIKKQENIHQPLIITYKIEVFDEMLYTYSAIDCVMEVHQFVIEALKEQMDPDDITDQLLTYTHQFGFNLIEIKYNNL